jgi:hypothetical protein
MILLGLAIEYWYISLAIVAIVIVIAVVRVAQQRRLAAAQELELARNRPGPRNPWLNEVAVALADLGLTEIARNTGAELGGAPMDGDIGVQGDRFLVYLTLFSDQRLARQAELGLLAKPDVRAEVANGRSAIKTADRIVFVANGRGGTVDEFRLDEVARVVGRLAVPPSLQPARTTSSRAVAVSSPDPDVLEQLRKLGDLRTAGVLTRDEFEAKTAELLGRI